MTFKEHLDKLGTEFITATEIEKTKLFSEALIEICDYLGISKMVNEAENNTGGVINVFKSFYDSGYYAGLKRGLEADDDTTISDSELLTKHQDLFAKEYKSRMHQNEF